MGSCDQLRSQARYYHNVIVVVVLALTLFLPLALTVFCAAILRFTLLHTLQVCELAGKGLTMSSCVFDGSALEALCEQVSVKAA